MLKGKGYYLKKLTSQMRLKSVDVGRKMEGTTPPSVFVGSWNYPKVYAGPMFTPYHGDTSLFDTPERWIPEQVTTEGIIDFRLNMVRGKEPVKVTDVESRFVEKLREVSMASGSVEGEAQFTKPPVGRSFSDEHLPYGPSAMLDEFEVDGCRWERNLEKAHYDSDLNASDAVVELHSKGVEFSRIQKALSVGALGVRRRRRLVPTRWSITACDSTLGGRLLDEVRHYGLLDTYHVYEFSSLSNYYAVILMPTAWQYEWMEAYLHVLGPEELIFSDWESNIGKRGYSRVGGYYYSCKFAVLEALARMRKQAGAIILREAYPGYIPLGVFNVRENVRSALAQHCLEFPTLRDALAHVSTKMKLPISRFIRESNLLKDLLTGRQTTLT
ncbi:MAG: Nre family DNA repair protein [Candidatus Altiarchaeota archaeon]